MAGRNRIYLDTSALFAGIWSESGGARMPLKLGEAEAVQLLVGRQVLAEIEEALRRKAPRSLGLLAVLLDRSGIQVVPDPSPEIEQKVGAFVDHPGDAQVIAAAWAAGVDYLVTLDQEHLLNNSTLRQAAPFPLGTPGDCLAWLREGLAGRS